MDNPMVKIEGTIPSRWREVALRELALDMFGGGTPSTKCAEYWNGELPWTTTAIIEEDDIYLNRYQRCISAQGLAASSARVAPKGSVLIGTRVGVGKAAVASFDIAINQDLTVLVPTEDILPEFLVLALKQHTIQKWFDENKRGSTIKGVPRTDIANLKFLLPPLTEQRAIAHVLWTVQQAKEATEKVIAAARHLKQSLMRHLFTYGPVPFHEADQVELQETGEGAVPKHWPLVRLADHAEKITKGTSPKWQGFDYCSDGNIFVRSQNIGWDRLELDNIARLPPRFNEEHKNSIIRDNDVLLNLVGASIGRVAVADTQIAGGNLNQAVGIVRLRGRLDPHFLMGFLLTKPGQYQIHRQKKEIARANISLQDVGNFSIPLASWNEQQEIRLILEVVERKLAAEEKQVHAFESLFRSLLDHLMTGQLRVQDMGVPDVEEAE